MFSWRETKQYRKDIKRYRHLKNYLHELNVVRNLLISGEVLPIKYRDHPLEGNDLRDCHIKPDFVLLYLKDNSKKAIVFVRVGSHSELDL